MPTFFQPQPFDRAKHIYRNDAFAETLKDAIRFFQGTPVLPLPLPESFEGCGIYAIYNIGQKGLYAKFGLEINRLAFNLPIYIGKAVPQGWRQSRGFGVTTSNSLFQRLSDHIKSISSARNLDISDFYCRFMIFEGDVASMIPTVEAAVIALHNPLWNSIIDGFGNHDPGGRRMTGRLSAWDALHPGRSWTKNITGSVPDVKELKRRITDYLIGKRG